MCRMLTSCRRKSKYESSGLAVPCMGGFNCQCSGLLFHFTYMHQHRGPSMWLPLSFHLHQSNTDVPAFRFFPPLRCVTPSLWTKLCRWRRRCQRPGQDTWSQRPRWPRMRRHRRASCQRPARPTGTQASRRPALPCTTALNTLLYIPLCCSQASHLFQPLFCKHTGCRAECLSTAAVTSK